jgi:hypothetical protein
LPRDTGGTVASVMAEIDEFLDAARRKREPT